jgi:hypothetical protein
MAFYPADDLLEKARSGDLFASHIVHEAVPLHDPAGRLDELRAVFRPPASYAPQITAASDLAWFLVDHEATLPAGLANARIAWCARTIAIARAAQRGRIAFSPTALRAAIDAQELPGLVGLKDRHERLDGTTHSLERFARTHGCNRPLTGEQPSVRRYKRHFEATANGFGLKTIRQARLKAVDGGYI